jgi:hypothetical protein
VNFKLTHYSEERAISTSYVERVVGGFVVGYFELPGAAVIGGLENLFQSNIARNHWNLRPSIWLSPDD